jgi:hypothetical protein
VPGLAVRSPAPFDQLGVPTLYARQLLHAFADAGQPSATGVQLFMGPNGGLMWTDGPGVDRSEPYGGAAFPTPAKPAPVDAESPVIVRLPEPTGSSVYTPLEAPASN